MAPSADVLTYDYGSGSTGVNASETILTPANLNVASFGKLSTTGLDGIVYAEPLVEQNVPIGAGPGDSAVNLVGGSGIHGVVFVATENDTLYAIDTAPGSGAILWQRSFTSTAGSYTGSTPGTNINSTLGATTVSAVPSSEVMGANLGAEIGITGTPVIDPTSGTLCVLVTTKEIIGGTTHYVQRLHGINVGDGTDRLLPFLIGDTWAGNSNNTQIFVYGTGDGNVPDPNQASDGNPGTTIVQFNAMRELNRPALSLENGQVYAAWASYEDTNPYHGWVVSWNVSGNAFQLAGWFCTSPNDGLAGIWMGGGALQFEPDGSAFYFETGNGSGGPPTLNAQGFPSDANYNEALVKIVADPTSSINTQGPNGWGMKVADYFIPYNVDALDGADSDFGSGSPLLLSPSAGIPGHPNLMLAAGKAGVVYLIDRDNLGKFDPVNDNVVNAVDDGSGHLEPPNLISGSLSTPAYYNGKVYWVSGYGGPAATYQISSSGLISPTSQTTTTFGFEPGSVVVSADGTNNGIVWVVDRDLKELQAYDASTFSTKLWNSDQAAGGRDTLGTTVQFAVPTVANGEVFAATTNSLVIYGLTRPPSGVPNAPVLTAATLSGQSINLSWTDSTTAPNTATGYAIEESTDNVTFSVVTVTPAGSTSVAIGGLQPLTTYYFRIRGFNSFGGTGYSLYSNTASATTTNLVPLVDFSGGFSSAVDTMILNATAAVNGSKLELTTSSPGGQAGSAFLINPVDITRFDTQFAFQVTPAGPSAEGFTFTIQNDGSDALGSAGGGLGYGAASTGGSGGITDSVALKFDLADTEGEGNDSTGLYLNGTAPTYLGSNDLTGSGVNLHSGDVFLVHLAYDGAMLTETITDTQTGATAAFTYMVNVPAIVGAASAYVGFTGSTGSATATQDILTWSFFPYAAFSPNAPSGLGATAASATSVALTWTNNATTQTGFHLERATDSNFTQNVVTENLPPSLSSYTDIASGLAPGNTYYYRIRAFNGAGDSGYSNVATVAVPVAPPTPTNALVTSVTASEIKLSWQDNAGHQAGSYAILRSVNHGSYTQVATLPPTSRTPPSTYTWSDSGLAPGTYYEFAIEAVNVSGSNGFALSAATTLTMAPTGLTALGSNGSVTLSWTAPTGAVRFNIYRGAVGAEAFLASTSATTFTDVAVGNGGVYYYEVTAVNSNGGTLANESAASTEVLAAPDALPASTVAFPYNQTINPAWGGGNQVLTVGNITNPIPGLILPASGTGTLTISGAPTTAGTESFTLTAVDTDGTEAVTNYRIMINPALALSPSTLPGDVGSPYSQTITAIGGTPEVTLSVSNFSSTIGGLTVPAESKDMLTIFGTPTTTGTATFTVTAIDSVGAKATMDYTITVNPSLTLSLTSLPQDTVNVNYNQAITALGGTPEVTLTVSNVSGAITGLMVPTSATGTLSISGTPTAPGTETFTLTAIDAVGTTVAIPYTIVVNPIITITPFKLPTGTIGAPYNQTITAAGGTGDLSLVVSNLNGAIPGLTVPTSGSPSISGTPTATGMETFTVTATDAVGAVAVIPYTLSVAPPAPYLSMPSSSYSGAVNTMLLNYPISISKLSDAAGHTGLVSAALVLTYPAGLFGFPLGSNLASTYVNLGSVPLADTAGPGGASDWNLTATSPADGKLIINLSAKAGDAITSDTGGGTLVTISFPILATAPPEAVTLTLINNSSGHTQIVGTNGAFVLGPPPPYAGSITITSGVPAGYLVTATASGTVQAGSGFVVGVQAVDASDNPITNYTGPASVDISIGPTGAGAVFPSTVSINSSGLGIFLATLFQAGSYTITAASGALTGSLAPLTVTPAPPVKLAFGVQPVSTPTGLVLPPVTVQVEDAYGNLVSSDNSDVVTLGIASGPGSFAAGGLTTATAQNGIATFSKLTLTAPGSYVLSGIVPGTCIGPNSMPFTVLPLQVVAGSFLGTPEGFSLQFNVPLLVNSTTPVLFGHGATALIPSVTLTRILDASGNPVNNPVEGSLILNASSNRLTFLATNTAYEANNGSPLLPDGTYVAKLTSKAAANGFQALNGGGFLDGLASGTAGSGDFTTTFTVSATAAGADVLWVPATADGPGQLLSAPGMNQAGAGYPIYLNDSTGVVTDIQVTLNYDPALLTVTGVSGPNVALLAASAPGQALLQYRGPALPAGNQVPIGFLIATVPAGTAANPTPYKAKDLLDLSGVSLNGGTLPVVTSAGLHLVAYVGDADGNGSYSSNDAVLITRAALQSDSGFAAYPLVDPAIMADTDGSGFIPADAALQANEAGVNYPTANLPSPPIPAGVVFQSVGNNVDTPLSLPSNLQPRPDRTLAMPVNNAGTRQTAVPLSSTTPTASAAGSNLVIIDFHPNSGASTPVAYAPGSSGSMALVSFVNPRESQVVSTMPVDEQGTLTLAPVAALDECFAADWSVPWSFTYNACPDTRRGVSGRGQHG
jgi:fibronectin type 3 domain-containing protein